MLYEILDDMFSRTEVVDDDHDTVCGTAQAIDHRQFCPWTYKGGDGVGPKFDSVAAAILWTWSLDSSQDAECGDAQYGNGWSALFRDERAVLNTTASGAVYAWRVGVNEDLDATWSRVESGAVYADDVED